MNRYLVLFFVFIGLVILLAVGLRIDPRRIETVLLDKPAPAFTLKQLHEPEKTFSSKEMLGKVWMLNVWASWCGTCRQEHPLFNELAKQNIVPLIGLNYQDQRNDALGWLGRLGNPYLLSVVDDDGRVGIDFGVYAVPETFVIDKKGVIRYKEIGAISAEVMQQKILPLIEQLKKEEG